MPKRIQLKRSRGWRMPAGTVKVDRTTIFGNPFVVGDGMTARLAVQKYRQALLEDPTSGEMLETLRGKDLACWCKLEDPCHADVLLELANR